MYGHNTAGFPKSVTEEERKENVKRTSNQNSPYNNPCLKEQKMSYDCLSENNYNQDECQLYFANYKGCRSFWLNVRAERRAKGIIPHLPWPEEREQIKAEYMKKFPHQ